MGRNRKGVKSTRVRFKASLGVQAFEDQVAPFDPINSSSHAFVFDYGAVTFVSIDTHVHALMLYNHLAERGCEVRLDWPNGAPRSYAQRMGFFSALDGRVSVKPDCYRGDVSSQFSNNSLLELTPIHRNSRASLERCIELVHDRARQAIGNERVTDEFTTVAQEVLTNIEDWSETEIPGIVSIQRYSSHVAISIADGGIGIIGSLRKNLDLGDSTDSAVLGRVFTEGLSSRQQGGGAGLRRCVDIAARYEARLMIRTNQLWSKLIVNAKKGGGDWHVWDDDCAYIPGTVLTFEFVEDRLREASY